MAKWLDHNGIDVDAYPSEAFQQETAKRKRRNQPPRCPRCGDVLTDRTTKNGAPTYCDTCDAEVL